jgi:hypothetical protein
VRLLLDHPWALLALLLAVPLAWLALRSRPTLSSQLLLRSFIEFSALPSPG